MRTHISAALALIAGFGFSLAPTTAKADWHGHGHGDWHGHGWWGGGHHGGYYGPRYYGPSIYVEPSVVVQRPYYREVYEGRQVHSSVEMDVQSALRKRGYYHGPIDGDIGPGSRAAIRAYQQDHDLRATGTITNGLLDRLGL